MMSLWSSYSWIDWTTDCLWVYSWYVLVYYCCSCWSPPSSSLQLLTHFLISSLIISSPSRYSFMMMMIIIMLYWFVCFASSFDCLRCRREFFLWFPSSKKKEILSMQKRSSLEFVVHLAIFFACFACSSLLLLCMHRKKWLFWLWSRDEHSRNKKRKRRSWSANLLSTKNSSFLVMHLSDEK